MSVKTFLVEAIADAAARMKRALLAFLKNVVVITIVLWVVAALFPPWKDVWVPMYGGDPAFHRETYRFLFNPPLGGITHIDFVRLLIEIALAPVAAAWLCLFGPALAIVVGTLGTAMSRHY